MNAQLPLSSATLSARRWLHDRFSSNSLFASVVARWLEHRVRLAQALAHLGQDGHGRLGRATEVLGELLARELEEHRVDHRANAGAARLVVEERELAEVLARAQVLEHDRRRVLVRARQVDLHGARLDDVHRGADVFLRKDDIARAEALLGEPRGERLAVLVGEPLEERNLREQVGGTHHPPWSRGQGCAGKRASAPATRSHPRHFGRAPALDPEGGPVVSPPPACGARAPPAWSSSPSRMGSSSPSRMGRAAPRRASGASVTRRRGAASRADRPDAGPMGSV